MILTGLANNQVSPLEIKVQLFKKKSFKCKEFISLNTNSLLNFIYACQPHNSF